MADLDVTIAVEAVNNARGPLEQAAAQLERLESAMRNANQAGGGAPAGVGGLDADGAAQAHDLLAEAASNAALALQAEAMSQADADAMLGAGLELRLALSETMTLLEAQTLAYQTSLFGAAAACKNLGAATVAAAQTGIAKMGALDASLGRVAGSFAAATKQAERLRQVILSMQSVRVSASIHVTGLGGQTAGGGTFVTGGPTTLLVGDNPGGRELVSVTPLSGRGQTRVAPGSGLHPIAGFAGGTSVPGLPGGGTVRIEVPVVLDGVEVGRGAVEGTLDALMQRGVIEEVVGG